MIERDPLRLAALLRSGLLTNAHGETFERIVRIAARLLGTPVALVSVVEADRQVIRGSVGLGEPWASSRVMGLEFSYCRHALHADEPLVIPDARLDPRVSGSPAIQQDGSVAYLGIPLTSEGQVLGTLCVIDRHPRAWSADEVALLRDLAACLQDEIDLRLQGEQWRESDYRLRVLLQATHEGLTLHEDGVLLEVNEAFARMLGRPRAELVGRHVADFMTADARAAFGRQVAADSEEIYLLDFVAADGALVHAEVRPRSLLYEGRRVRASAIRDVTDKGRMEARLRESEALLRDLFDHSRDGIFITTLDGRFVAVNPAIADVTGYAPEELMRMRTAELYADPGERDRFRELLERNGAVQGFETRVRLRDGSIRDVVISATLRKDAAGEVLGYQGMIYDNTERKRAERALQASHTLLSTIIESSPDTIFAKDREGRFLLINRAGAALMGRGPEEVIGQFDEDLVPPEAARMFREADRRVLEGGEIWSGEQTSDTGVGVRTFEVQKAPLRGADGEVVGLVGVSRDVTGRKATEEALLRINERFALVQRATQDVIWDWDLVRGRVEWSEAMAHTFGHALQSEAVDRDWWAGRIHPDDRERVTEGLNAAVASSDAWSAEFRYLRGDGTYATVLDRGYVLRDGSGRAVRMIGSIQDVTERHRLVAALEQSEAHYRRLVNQTPQMIYALDGAGRFVEINPAGVHLLGRPAAEILGRPFGEVIADADRERAGEALQRLLAGTARTMEIEIRLRRSGGESPWVCMDATAIEEATEEGVAITGVHGIARDITGERDREAQRRLFAAALENLAEGVNVLDADGRILYVNAAYRAMLACEDGGCLEVGTQVLDFAADAGSGAEMAAALDEVLAAGVWRGRLSLRRADGAAIPVDAHMERVEHDGHAAVFSICRDVSAELEQEQRLRRAERLASIGTLVSGVAHELNNPLAAIVGFTQLLLMDERSQLEREDLETILREAQRMAEIVANLRLLARRTQTEEGAAPVDLNDVVRHVLRTRGYSLRTRNVEVREDLDAELPPVVGDRGHMEQIVLNLVVNAEQAMAGAETGGILIIRTRRSGRGVSLHVVDNGPGIRPEDLDRIFDPFFTTKGPGEGTGLGLSLVHSLVAEHGGEIHVDSKVGSGAAFRVDLIAETAERARGAAAAASEGADRPARALRALVVDDEEAVRRVVTRALALRGHLVDVAVEGGQALELLEDAGRRGAPYDVIVCDVRMPGLDGPQLLARLRESGTGMDRRLIFLTGDTATLREDRIEGAGGTPVLTKPIDLGTLVRAVEAVGE